jgi:hypothetical protein
MKKPVLLLLAGMSASMAFGQAARLIFNTGLSDPFMVFSPTGTTTTYLVVDNAATNAITQIPAGSGNIKSEHENNRVRWTNFGGTGAYVVPFTTASNVKMPLTVNKTTAGAGPAGHDSLSFVFATYNHSVAALPPATQWYNYSYMPTGVTHMGDLSTGTVDNSENAIDRFWIIDPQQLNYAYTTKPDVNITFAYDLTEVTAGNLTNGGIANATPIGAQRWNSGLNKWGDMVPQGAWAASLVSNAAIPGANFFRSWTLANIASPLPVELTSWTGMCDGKDVVLTWTTASENDNAFFTIEKSSDAQNWTEIGRVDAVGNSSTTNVYSFVDENAGGLAYYRLSQTDISDRRETFQTIASGCEANSTEIVNAWDDGQVLNLMVSSTEPGIYDLTMSDAQGKVMVTRGSVAINQGFTPLVIGKEGIASGAYMVTLQNANDVMVRRVFLH